MHKKGESIDGSVVRRVHEAWEKLLAGDVDLAIELLLQLRSQCMSYSSFHVVFGSALFSRGQYEDSLAAARWALKLTPESPHAKLIADLSQERLEENVLATASVPPIEPTKTLGIDLPAKPTLASLLDPIGETEPVTQFDIDRIADELARERPLVRPVPEPEHIQPMPLPEVEEGPALISETLAEIMIRQGKLTDAKKVYIQLSRSQPERYQHFKSKIEAIDKLLLGTSIAPETTPNDPAV